MGTVIPGIVSVTFRAKTVEEIVDLTARAGLSAIEWGGDVHVPSGDTAAAERARRVTESLGLAVASYGSYYRAGAPGADFAPVLATAQALGAPNIRVWAGTLGSVQASADDRARIAADLAAISNAAAAQGVRVSMEYHGGTLTDTTPSTLALMEQVGHPNLYTYWQPPHGVTPEEGEASLAPLLARLSNVHVFHWFPSSGSRHPLADGADRWKRYLATVAGTGREHYALLEFVKDDSEAQFLEDAATLRGMLG